MVRSGLQRRLTYFPDRSRPPRAESVLRGASEVTLSTSDGLALGAWYVAPDDPVGAVLVCNGNGGHRAGRAPLAARLRERGLAVLLFDYRGYADNPGKPSEAGLARDADAALARLAVECGRDVDRIVVLGESLGAAVATGLACRTPPGGLVLRSPFTDLAAVGETHYPFLPVRRLVVDRFPVLERIRTLQVPTIVVLGSADGVVPPGLSREVAKVAPDLRRCVTVHGADHNDPALCHGPDVVDAVTELAQRLV